MVPDVSAQSICKENKMDNDTMLSPDRVVTLTHSGVCGVRRLGYQTLVWADNVTTLSFYRAGATACTHACKFKTLCCFLQKCLCDDSFKTNAVNKSLVRDTYDGNFMTNAVNKSLVHDTSHKAIFCA